MGFAPWGKTHSLDHTSLFSENTTFLFSEFTASPITDFETLLFSGYNFVFKHLFGILDYLIDILTILQKVERHHKKYAEINMLEVFKERVEYARQDLKTIGNGQGNVKIRTGHGTLG